MKHKVTYYAVLECRGMCGYQDARLFAGDNGKCDKAVGFDTLRAARDFVRAFVAERGRQATTRNIELKEKRPNDFYVTWETQDSCDGRWHLSTRWFKIEPRTFALFTVDDVATRMIQSY